MQTGPDIVATKYEELVERFAEYKAGKFTSAEEAIWLIITMRCEMDMANFASVFEQVFSDSEVKKAIKHLDNIGFTKEARLVEKALNLLVEEKVYDDQGNFLWDNHTESVKQKLDEIQLELGDKLWNTDDKLAELLNNN